jgi:hypothetical protein
MTHKYGDSMEKMASRLSTIGAGECRPHRTEPRQPGETPPDTVKSPSPAAILDPQVWGLDGENGVKVVNDRRRRM